MFTWLWTWLRKYRFSLLAGGVLVLAVCGLNLVPALLSRQLVDDVIKGGQTSLLWPLLGITMGVVIVKTLMRYVFQMIFENVSQRTIRSIREEMFQRMQHMEFAFHDRTRTGDIMALMTGDMEAVRHFVAWVLYQVLENATIFVLTIITLFFMSPLFTLMLLGVTPVIAFLAFRLSRTVLPTFRAIRDQFSRLNTLVQENIAGNRVIRAFVREDHEIRRFEVENAAYKDRNLENARIWGTWIPLIDFFSGLLFVVLVVAGGIFIIQDRLTMGEFVAINGLIWAISNPLRMAGWLVNDVQRFLASCRRLKEMAGENPAITGPAAQGDTDGAVAGTTPAVTGRIEFRRVGFAYPGQEHVPVLSDIDLSIPAGSTLGIVGATGSGKSTLARLMARFYDPSEGQILLDGKDLREWPLEEVRRAVGLSMQDVFLFSDTLEGNIAFGRPEIAMDDIIKASVMANAHHFIQEMPEGYDTIVGERGVGLSGGQRQRVALARLLTYAPPVMILDDTTSAVDVETEERIQHAVQGLHGRCTLCIIAHRISSVKHADHIIVLDQGRIVESGRHDELLAAGGAYAAVCRHQAGMED